MTQPFLDSGQPHSGSYLFVRSQRRLSDGWLLDATGLGDYQPADALYDLQRHVVIGHSPMWTVIGDDWDVEKFHSPSALKRIAKLMASVDEVFSCLLPDIDDSFEFSYWRNGALVRSFQKRSKDWGRTYTVQQQGIPLDAETAPITANDEPTERVWPIARSLGFDLADSVGT